MRRVLYTTSTNVGPGDVNRRGRATKSASALASVFLITAIAIVALQGTALATPKSWSISLPTSQGNPDQLNGVDCHTSTFCLAVGGYTDGSGTTENVSQIWTGTKWSAVTVPDRGSGNNSLNGVSCSTPKFCMAVGYEQGQYRSGLIETYNGIDWTVSSVLSHAVGNYSLSGVSCPTNTFCVAVGQLSDDAGTTPVIDIWNGTSWTLASFSTTLGSALTSVSCPTTKFCVAAGNITSTEYQEAFTETLKKGSWTQSSTLSPPVENVTLSGVSCVSASSCRAVGNSESDAGLMSLIYGWNGKKWKQTSGNMSDAILTSVSCASTTKCVAAGYSEQTSTHQNFIETLNGTPPTWLETTTPDQDSGANELLGLSCRSGQVCMSVGYYYDTALSGNQELALLG
jgi:hypothetical protein